MPGRLDDGARRAIVDPAAAAAVPAVSLERRKQHVVRLCTVAREKVVTGCNKCIEVTDLSGDFDTRDQT